MRLTLFFALSLGLVASGIGFCVASGEEAVHPVVDASPSPKPVPLNVAQKAMLRLRLSRAQYSERRALEHKYRMQQKELKASIAAREAEFKKSEIEEFKKFRATSPKGDKNREYVKQMHQRKKAFRETLAEEKAQRKREQDARLSALKTEQSEKFKEFNEYLTRGETPPLSLWPSN